MGVLAALDEVFHVALLFVFTLQVTGPCTGGKKRSGGPAVEESAPQCSESALLLGLGAQLRGLDPRLRLH